MLKGFRAFVTEAQDTFVDRISNDCPDAGSAPECCTALRLDPVLIQVSGNLVGTIALDRDEPVDLLGSATAIRMAHGIPGNMLLI